MLRNGQVCEEIRVVRVGLRIEEPRREGAAGYDNPNWKSVEPIDFSASVQGVRAEHARQLAGEHEVRAREVLIQHGKARRHSRERPGGVDVERRADPEGAREVECTRAIAEDGVNKTQR